jgi:hypothetical protein
VARWEDVGTAAPALAERARRIFEAQKHKTIATLRRDGSPRISGVEVDFAAGEAWIGMMPGSRKALDLRRDPRFALHNAPVDPHLADGDAKIAGKAIEVTDRATLEAYVRRYAETKGSAPPEPFHLFRADITEVVVTRIDDPPDHLLIESWHEGEGTRRVARR